MGFPEVNSPAPDFIAQDHQGNDIDLSDYPGKWVVLFFYPKDMTPGCTTEACDFRDYQAQFFKKNAVVLGVSKCSGASHLKFASKHALSFPLLLDEEGRLCEKYGVWQEKKNYGRTYMGIVRTTFLINPAGIIEKVYAKVRVKDHVKQVYLDIPE